MKISQHRVFCETDAKYEYKWLEEGETLAVCPVDPAHTITVGSDVIVQELEDLEVRTVDGRLRVRADSLPVGTTTGFICQGDNLGVSIGGGKDLYWDFSNSDDVVSAPSGFTRKQIDLVFNDPVYIKEGTVYFMDALKSSNLEVSVVCPNGGYYLNRSGTPTQAAGDVTLGVFIRKHFFAGSCPMGDELNTEVAQDNALPPGYYLRCIITVPDTDTASYGWGSIELYRTRTVLYPGESL